MTQPLRILLVSRSFPAHRAGGMENHVQDILEGMIAAGHEVHVLTSPLPRREGLRALAANGTATSVGGRDDGRYDRAFWRESPRAAARICSTHRIDIVHAQGFTGIPLVLGSEELPPVATTVHGTLFSETPLYGPVRATSGFVQSWRDLWRFKHRLVFIPTWRRFLARDPHLIVDSKFTAKELRFEDQRLDPVLVPLGFDTAPFEVAGRDEFDPSSCSLRESSGTKRPMLLFAVGRLEEIKGFELLIEMAAHLGDDLDWHLVVGGEGPDRPRLEKRIPRALRERVHFPGRLPASDLPRWHASADVFLNPDGGYPAFGLTIAEALCAGTPVVATPHGAHPELVGDGDGELVGNQADLDRRAAANVLVVESGPRNYLDATPAESAPRLWAAAVRRAIAWDTGERRAARQARAIARFRRELMIERLEDVYRTIIGRR